MSNTISSLTAANSIDPVNDYLPIDTANLATTQKINRNTLLGLGSAPVGLTDSQTLTNKILTSPTINGATLSGTLSGTYTIGGTPTFPSSVVTLTGTQALTNKTLTSPTITAPTITNAAISADTLTGFTVSNNGTVYGMSVTGGVLASAALAGAVNTAAIQNSAVTGAQMSTYKVVRQDDTTNSTETAARILSGWGVIIPGVANVATEAVTFNSAFSSRPIVIAVYGGDNASATTYGAGGTNATAAAYCTASVITTTGFTIRLRTFDGGNWSAGNTVFYQWIAIGN